MLKKGTIIGKTLIKITTILFFSIIILIGCVGTTDYIVSLNKEESVFFIQKKNLSQRRKK